jgi:hypothetical protein
MNSRRSALAVLAAALAVGALSPPPALAQDPRDLLVQFDRVTNTVTIDASYANVRDVIDQLFSQAGAPKVDVDPRLRGRVKLHLKGAQRDVVLRAALEQVGATYTVRNGVYDIRAAERRPGGGSGGSGGSGPVTPLPNVPVPPNLPPIFLSLVEVNARSRPIGEYTNAMTRQTGVAVRYDRALPGDILVDATASRETFWKVIHGIAAASQLRVEVSGPREVTLRPLPSFEAWYRGRKLGSVGERAGSCRRCRYERKAEWRFCPMCGERLE